MLFFLPRTLRGVIAAALLGVNTLFWCSLVFVLALVKVAIPIRAIRVPLDHALNEIATRWVACNSGWMRLVQHTRWDVAGLDGLDRKSWYMVNCNHQSWVDIIVLQHLLNRRIPLLKFFLKQQLIWVPVIGLAWWALDFPFMRRHSDAYLTAHPEKRFEDLDATRRACRKFARVPTSVMNFPEGTRFTAIKHRAQRSPVPPSAEAARGRAGARAFRAGRAGSMRCSTSRSSIQEGAPTFWQFLCGDVPAIVVRARRIAIPAELAGGDYAANPRFRKAFQRWLAALWRDKDAEIGALLGPRGAGERAATAPVEAPDAGSGQVREGANAPT